MTQPTHSPLPDPLAASALFSDVRMHDACERLLDIVREHQNRITAVRPPRDDLHASYEQLLEAFSAARGGPLWYPYVASGIGNGALVELCDGSVKYDFITGIGPHFFGHSHPVMITNSLRAALGDTVMQGHLQQTRDGLILSQMLLENSGLDHCFLTTSGVMAVENGLKIAFQARHPANRIIAFERCFTGRTLAASQITDKAAYRQGLPDTVRVDYIPFFDPQDPDGSQKRAIERLHEVLHRYPKKHAVFCMELIQGEGGFRVGSSSFFKTLIQVCKEHEILVLIDEVQTFGRTPQLYAYQYFDLQTHVDIVSLGKVLQVCATLFRKELAPRPGLLSQTFTGSTTALSCAQAIVHTLLHDGFLGPNGRIEQLHAYIVSKLNELSDLYPGAISGPFGLGGMVAFTPFDGKPQTALTLCKRLFENGLIAFSCGYEPTRIRFLPPMGILTNHDIDAAIDILGKTIEAYANG